MNDRACEFTDAIIARHLDGDVDPGLVLDDLGQNDRELEAMPGWLPADRLAEHLRECATCQRQLQRARRLDAVLAEASGRDRDPEQDNDRLAELLRRAVAAAAPAPTTPGAAGRQPARHRLLTGALLVATGFLAALLIVGPWRADSRQPDADSHEPRPAGADNAVAAGAAGAPQPSQARPAEPGPAIARGIPVFNGLAGANGIGLRQRRPAPIQTLPLSRSKQNYGQLAHLFADRQLADRLLLVDSLRLAACSGVVVLPYPRRAAPAPTRQLALQIRRRCSRQLLRARQRTAWQHWIEATANLGGGPLLEAVLANARQQPALLSRLRAMLRAPRGRRGDFGADLTAMATLAAAARIGGNELDGAIRQLLRRNALHDELAAAVRVVRERPGRTSLLLDVWSDRVARGGKDDERLARVLFAQQPSTVAAELTVELQRTRRTPRRVRCLLALGAVAAPTARTSLLAALRSPSLPEAHAAAFALGMLPYHELTDLVASAEAGPQSWLLRAALCCAGEPRARAWIESLDVSPAERELLATGGFSFAQFPVFADILRERGLPTF